MEPAPDQILTLCDLRDAIAQDRITVINADVAITYLDLAVDALGDDEFHQTPCAASQAAFEARFPDAPDDALIRAFGDGTTYQRWRRNVAMNLCFAGLSDATEPFVKLGRFAKRDGLPVPNRQVLERAFPARHPRDIDRMSALDTDRGLAGHERWSFRQAIRALDTLRKIEAVRACGLLDLESIGPFPEYCDGDQRRVELPPQLRELADAQSVWDKRRMRRLFEIGVHAGLLDDAEDIAAADFVDARLLRALYDAACEKTSTITADGYLQTLVRVLQGFLPETMSARLGAIDPRPGRRRDARRDRARRPHGRDTPAKPGRGQSNTQRLPDYVEDALTRFEMETTASKVRLKNLRTILRRFVKDRPAHDMTVLLEDATTRFELLFAHCTDATRACYRRDLTAFLVHTGQGDDWMLLSRRASRAFPKLFCGRGIGLLARLSADHVPPLRPRDVSRGIALGMAADLRRDGPHNRISRLNTGIASLDRLRPRMPDLLDPKPIGALPDARRGSNLALPPQLEDALKAHADQDGFTAFGTRATLVAVRTLYSLAHDKAAFDRPLDRIPFDDLLRMLAPDNVAMIAPYRNEINALAARLSIGWTRGWRDLQAHVVAAGTARCDNPLEALACIAIPENLEPWQLDREWAWTHERGLRPDLRLTFARNIARFDTLRGIETVAQAGLMPRSRLGPMPSRRERFRNAVYPLPPQIEVALDGEHRSLVEAVYFVWRIARETGLYARGDAPEPRELFSECVLAHVENMSNRGVQITRAHLARIRDFCACRMDLETSR